MAASRASRPRVVALLSPGWPREAFTSGLVSYTAEVRQALRDLGIRVFVLSLQGPEGAQTEDVVPIIRQPSNQSLWARGHRGLARARVGWLPWEPPIVIPLLREIERLHRDEGLDLLQMEESFGMGRLVAPRSPVPVVLNLAGPWFLNGAAAGRDRERAFRHRVRREGVAMRRAAALVAPSLDVLERTRVYYRIPATKGVVIPNPVSAPPATGVWRLSDCDPRRILFVGRFDRLKGGDLVVSAFSRVLDEIPDCRLSFVGPDPGLVDASGGRTLIGAFADACLADPKKRQRLEYLGPCPPSEIDKLRCQSLVTVVASRYETFCYTAVEAMRAGCPVVAPEVGGIPEIVLSGRNGLLFRAGDSESLADSLLHMLRAPEQAARLGSQARRDSALHFDPESVGRRLASFYADVIDRDPAKARRPK